MATICFRPPPLPPSRKSPSNNQLVWTLNTRSSFPTSSLPVPPQQRYRGKQHHHLLSSTYLSFRDPAEDEVPEEVEMADLKARNGPKRGRKVSHSNSFGREGSRDPRAVITRSHSEGNLKKIGGSHTNINRYMKVLSGSWRNLLNRERIPEVKPQGWKEQIAKSGNATGKRLAVITDRQSEIPGYISINYYNTSTGVLGTDSCDCTMRGF
nr:unnamed protein product [Callosobruchus analis]